MHVYLCVGMCMLVQVHVEARRGIGSPEDVVTGSSELLNVGDRNQIHILGKSKCFLTAKQPLQT